MWATIKSPIGVSPRWPRQDADGYVGTYLAADRWSGWDVWSHRYCMVGLLAYHRLTGNRSALQASCAIGDLRTLKAYETLFFLNGVIDLYRLTGEEHLTEAVFCYGIRIGGKPSEAMLSRAELSGCA